MEFLILTVVVVLAVFVAYKYYQVRTIVYVEPTVLDLVEEVKPALTKEVNIEIGIVSVQESEKRVESVKEEIKKIKVKKEPKSPAKADVATKRTRKNGKFVGDDKSTPEVNEAFKEGKAPPKKKNPNIKIVK